MTITGNNSPGFNGGLYVGPGQSVVVNNSTISNNTTAGAGVGGGIAVGPTGSLLLTNSTVSGESRMSPLGWRHFRQ